MFRSRGGFERPLCAWTFPLSPWSDSSCQRLKRRSWQSFKASSVVHPEEWSERLGVRQDALDPSAANVFQPFWSETLSPSLSAGSVASAQRCKVCLLSQAADSVVLCVWSNKAVPVWLGTNSPGKMQIRCRMRLVDAAKHALGVAASGRPSARDGVDEQSHCGG